MNVLGYDPIWDGRNAVFTVTDFQLIASAGYDTVRINLRPFTESLRADNSLEPAWIKKVDNYISQGLASGLNVIVDYHDHDGWCSANFSQCEPRLTAFWAHLSKRYSRKPLRLIFEILNEPHFPLSDETWNRATKSILKEIRKIDKNRLVIVSPTGYSSISKLNSFKPPSDNNIMTTIHYYDPHKFTKQFKPRFVFSGEETQYLPWGSVTDRNNLSDDFDRAAAWGVRNRQRIILGEFGVWDDVPIAYRASYLHSVVEAAEQRGIAWVYWQYQHDFRAIDNLTHYWIPEIEAALQGGPVRP